MTARPVAAIRDGGMRKLDVEGIFVYFALHALRSALCHLGTSPFQGLVSLEETNDYTWMGRLPGYPESIWSHGGVWEVLGFLKKVWSWFRLFRYAGSILTC